jgi:hypothetical protein
MAKMIVILFAITALTVLAGSASAQKPSGSADDTCTKIEYAELKDKSQKSLQVTYCLYTALNGIEHEAFEKLLPLDTVEADAHRLQAAQCGQEAGRILHLLKKKPDCEASIGVSSSATKPVVHPATPGSVAPAPDISNLSVSGDPLDGASSAPAPRIFSPCTVSSEFSTFANRTIPLGKRLIANYEHAQTWEQVDPDHPDAVVLRSKIAAEENEYAAAIKGNPFTREFTDTEIKSAYKTCAELMNETTPLMKEWAEMSHDLKNQKERYHALGH